MPRGKKGSSPEVQPSEATPRFTDTAAPPPPTNVPPALIAKALTDMLTFNTQMASLAGLKGAAINRYEEQGIDREILAGLVKLARKSKQEDAMAYITSLTQYAVASEVIPPRADDRWTASVKQSEMFTPATGTIAEELRIARGHKEGFQAGRKGHSLESNPYAGKPGSPEFVGWRDGLTEGLNLRREIKPGSENVTRAAATATPRKGRRAAAKAAPEEPKTQLERDTEDYRKKGVGNIVDGPATPQ